MAFRYMNKHTNMIKHLNYLHWREIIKFITKHKIILLKLNILAPSSHSTLGIMINAHLKLIKIKNGEAIDQNIKYEKETKQQNKKTE